MFFFFLMIRRPPRSTLDRSSAASDVYKRQVLEAQKAQYHLGADHPGIRQPETEQRARGQRGQGAKEADRARWGGSVSYTHLRAHETVLDIVCRLLLEKKNN